MLSAVSADEDEWLVQHVHLAVLFFFVKMQKRFVTQFTAKWTVTELIVDFDRDRRVKRPDTLNNIRYSLKGTFTLFAIIVTKVAFFGNEI